MSIFYAPPSSVTNRGIESAAGARPSARYAQTSYRSSRRHVSLDQSFERLDQVLETTQKREQKMISTLHDYYIVKKAKNEELKDYIQTANRDRPLTQEIRLRKLLSAHKEKRPVLDTKLPIERIREDAEEERRNLARQNNAQYQWYEDLVNKTAILASNEKDDLTTCHFILNQIRKILIDPNTVQPYHIFQILEEINAQEDTYPVNDVTMTLIKKVLDHFGESTSRIEHYKRIHDYDMLSQRRERERMQRLKNMEDYDPSKAKK